MIEINFYNEYNEEFDNLYQTYLKIGQLALDKLKLTSNYEISVTLVDNQRIHEINREYRFKDYATDVISFESGMHTETYLDEIDLGDIFISVDKAKEQALEYQHSLARELTFLFVHGLLHCLGYDHLNEEQEKEMFSLQEVILDAYKIQEEN